jgi:bifunctional non-homologous end joining protein LigD
VIQEHSARRLHWDLRLERDGVLVSWALPRGLPLAPKQNFVAPHTEDHPLSYLDFAGEIPAGNYGAGTMTIWDRGTYETLEWEPRKIEVTLDGERVRGRYALFAIGKETPTKDWMIHRMDPPADPTAEPMPEHLVPMLARAGALPADDDGWSYEVKWDGVRAIAYSDPGRLRLESRNLLEITERYPELARLTRALGSHAAVLDGEIVSFDAQGRPSFEALARRIHLTGPAVKRLATSAPVTYLIFDLLWLDGHSLLELPYSERRAALAGLSLDGERWRTPQPLRGSGLDVLAASRVSGLEGLVAKRLDSRYKPGQRDGSWLKIKNTARQELVVGGFTGGAGRRAATIGALLVGIPDGDDRLRYAGKVGSGFSEAELERLGTLLAPLVRDRSPFVPGPLKLPRGACFVEPRLVVEVEFSEWTRDGALRAPSYKGLRDDKPARDVVSEPVEARPGRTVKLSNLDKILYPETGFTKRAVIDYYTAVAPVLLAHLRDRPLTVKRYPDGVAGKAFFEKRSPRHRPDWVRTVAVRSERHATIDYTVADDLDTLVWLANLAALELHAPLAVAADLEHPTAMVFDLDPGPPAGIPECARVALLLRGTFDELGLASFAKTSGSKGLQVYVPVAGASFAQTKRFAERLAQLFERTQGELVVSRQARSLRTGKVLIDWSQNDPHKTTICAYSLRARPRPTVSTPVTWDEVGAALDGAPLGFEADAVLERVAALGDLFAPVLAGGQALPAI